MSWVAAGVAAAGILTSTITKARLAKKQRERAEKLKVSDYVPPALKENKELFTQRMQSGVAPGQQHRESEIKRAGASAGSKVIRLAGGDSGKAIAGIAGIGAKTQDSLEREGDRGLAYSDAQSINLARGNAAIGRGQFANKRAFDLEKSALEGAAIQNKYGAMMEAAGGAQVLTSHLASQGVFGGAGGSVEKPGGGGSAQFDINSQMGSFTPSSIAETSKEVYNPWNGTDYNNLKQPNYIGGQAPIGKTYQRGW